MNGTHISQNNPLIIHEEFLTKIITIQQNRKKDVAAHHKNGQFSCFMERTLSSKILTKIFHGHFLQDAVHVHGKNLVSLTFFMKKE